MSDSRDREEQFKGEREERWAAMRDQISSVIRGSDWREREREIEPSVSKVRLEREIRQAASKERSSFFLVDVCA